MIIQTGSFGHILGPILFCIFTNNVVDTLSPNMNAALYADDSKVYRSIVILNDSISLQATR